MGHTAAVNCFLYPFEENQRYDPELFLSGGMDFAVIVWNIVTGTKLHRFCSQGGPILRLVVPPDNCNVSFLLIRDANFSEFVIFFSKLLIVLIF